jgi:hypothetical protein
MTAFAIVLLAVAVRYAGVRISRAIEAKLKEKNNG